MTAAPDGLVILGGGLAGAKAAEGARAQGWTGPIRLVGAERHLPYERPPLSKGLLIGEQQPAAADVHPDAFYTTNDIDLLLGTSASGIDLATRTVNLDGGRALQFDKLVLAMGSTPRRLRIEGGDLPEMLSLRTLDDSLALRDRLQPGRRLAVIGASWIGTEAAACARQRGCDVVMIDPLATPLERVLGPEVGHYMAGLHASHGVELRLGVGVESIVGTSHVEGVRLADGSVVGADLVVQGVGVIPNVDLARDAGLGTAGGVLVDSSLRASHGDVYAAGDIAEAEHPLLGRRVRLEHWANALNQGLAAGANAVGAGAVYDRIPYFFSDQYDMGMEYSGWPVPWDDVIFRGEPSSGAFVTFYMSDGKVVAGANINVPDANRHVQAVIRAGGEADVEKLADVDVDPSDWAPALVGSAREVG